MNKFNANIEDLKKAPDFKIIETEEYEYSFNEFRGGDFTDKVPSKVFAYGGEWNMFHRWIDKAWGDYEYVYSTNIDNVKIDFGVFRKNIIIHNKIKCTLRDLWDRGLDYGVVQKISDKNIFINIVNRYMKKKSFR